MTRAIHLVPLLAAALALLAAAPARAQFTIIVSESNDRQADGGFNITTGASCISGDGSTVGFYSDAPNLGVGGNNPGDLFVARRGGGGVLIRANSAAGMAQANRGIFRNVLTSQALLDSACSLSADGSLIAFASAATDLVPNNDFDNFADVFVRDLDGNEIIQVTDGNQHSFAPAISGNGDFVAFLSAATDLDPRCNNTDPSDRQVFLADIRNPNDIDIRCISVNAAGRPAAGTTRFAPSISDSGNTVVFDSTANNLAAGDGHPGSDVFLYRRGQDDVSIISLTRDGQPANGPSDNAAVSGSGNIVAFVSAATNLIPADDTNGSADIFVYDRLDNGGRVSAQRVNLSNSGGQAIPLEFPAGTDPEVSFDGRYITFVSDARLVVGDNNGRRDIFVRDRQEDTTTLISLSTSLTSGNGASFRPAISDDGQFIVYDSLATNLVPGGLDQNGGFDVYLTDQFAPPPTGEIFRDQFEN